MMVEQQLRAPPPEPPSGVDVRDEKVASALKDVMEFAHSVGGGFVVDSFQAARYDELLQRLALQRQEALKVSLRLEFCHQLKGMRKRQRLVRICTDALAEITKFTPITVKPAGAFMQLRADDWKEKKPPKLIPRGTKKIFEDELRDWYGVPCSCLLRLCTPRRIISSRYASTFLGRRRGETGPQAYRYSIR